MKFRKLGCFIPVLNDATSFYRAVNPLSELASRYPGIMWNNQGQWTDAVARAHDAVFLQRPFLNEQRGAMQLCLESGIKVWIDYDDLVTEVPTSNPTYFTYMTKENQDNIEWCIKNASVVTVSTNMLATKYSKWNKNIKVIPNAMDMRLQSVKERGTPKPRNKIVAWRGTPTHHKDILRFARAIMLVSRDEIGEGREWMWHFLGDTAWIVTDSMPHTRTFFSRMMGPLEYHRHIQALQPSLFQVPLDDIHFNRCKSNIAWMEASFAGAAALCPAWDEWKVPGAVNYETEEQFADALYAVFKGEIDVVARAKESWDFIQSELTLEKVNEARVEIICELFGCDKSDLR